MNLKTGVQTLTLFSLLSLLPAADACAQSAIYACGHMRRNRTSAIDKLRSSGYTTIILFNLNVEEDGSLTTDYDWSNQRPAEAGGIICRDGHYVFTDYQPEYVTDVRTLLTAPTSVSRIEICIGGWGNGSYGNIKKMIEKEGTDKESTLYRNFKALKEAIPEIVAVNNDQEQDYDLEAAKAFHKMLAEIGFKTTVAPYMNKDYWKELVAGLNEDPGTCEIVYLQTYGGGASNNPSEWKVFGDIPMYIGYDCEASSDLNAMVAKFESWRDNDAVEGGFLWNYNSEARDVNEWATAINRIFPTITTEEPAAIFYSDAKFEGYAVGLPEGSFTQADMALYGIKAADIASMKINNGFKVTVYPYDNFTGRKKEYTESAETLGSQNNRTCSLVIEKNDTEGVTSTSAEGAHVEVFNMTGVKVATLTGQDSSDGLTGMPSGTYVLKSGESSELIYKK